MSEPNPQPGDVSGSSHPAADPTSTGSLPTASGPTASVPVAPPPAYPPVGYATGEATPGPYAPVSAMPVSYGAYPPAVAAAPAKRSRAAIVFGILMAVFLLAAGGMTALYFVDKNAADRKIADRDQQISTLHKDVSDKTKELDDTKGDLRDANDEVAVAKQQAAATAGCVKSVQDFITASGRLATEGASAQVAANAAALKMISDCNVRV